MKGTMKRSFRTKLLVSFLVIGILPLLLCTLLMLNTFRVNSQRSAQDSAHAELSRLMAALDGRLAECAQTLDRLAGHETVLHALEGRQFAPGENIYYTLYEVGGALTPEADVSVLDLEGQCLHTTGSRRDGGALPTDWGALLAAGESSGVVFRRASGEGGDPVLRAARGVWDGDEPMGYLVADLRPQGLADLLEGRLAGAGLLLLDGHFRPVWATAGLQGETLAAQLRQRLLAGQALSAEKEENFCYLQKSEVSGFYLVLQQPKPVAGWVMQSLYFIAGLFILLCLALCVGLALRLSRQFFEPVRALNDAMSQVEQGNLDVRVNSRDIDELGQLAGRFDRMVDTLQIELYESVQAEKELREARIRMMQAQLNPHFLYNTLDTIKWMGKIHKAPEVSAISADLADILRQSISGEEFVPLAQELSLLDRYVEIQSIRFPGKFAFRTEIDPDALEATVPKLMLQPLVENAIIHGFEDGSSGTVTVSARVAAGELTVTVQDDGRGMSEESLARFRERDPSQSGHLGLRNVDTILRLHYGEDCGLRFLPRPDGRGTAVVIRLPVRERGGAKC